MNTWILKWYPEKYEWNEYNDALLKTKNNEMYRQKWLCDSNLERGDRVYIFKFDNVSCGVVASGYVNKKSYNMFYGYKKNNGFVDISLNRILDIKVEYLKQNDFYKSFPNLNLFEKRSARNITELYKVVEYIEQELYKIVGVSFEFKKYTVSTALWLSTAILSYELFNNKNDTDINDMYFSYLTIKRKALSISKDSIDEDMVTKWRNENNDNYIYNYLLKNEEKTSRLVSLNELWGHKNNIYRLVQSDIFITKIGIITAKELFDFINNEYIALLDANICNENLCLEDHNKKDNLPRVRDVKLDSGDSDNKIYNEILYKNNIQLNKEQNILYNSWEILNDMVALKTMDKSVFEHNGSGIPKEIRKFWTIENLCYGEKSPITLIYQNNKYNAYFHRESNEPFRTRLFWHKDLNDVIRKMFPDYRKYEINKEEYPILRFEKLEKDTYLISFIDTEYIDSDIELESDSEVSNEVEGFKEGKAKYFYSKKYERNNMNRKDAIKIHGTICVCCGFDFEKIYGSRGLGYIEIHHKKALYSLDEEVIINPYEDLVPVCSNCHRIIHRKRDDVLTVEEVKDLIKKNKIEENL